MVGVGAGDYATKPVGFKRVMDAVSGILELGARASHVENGSLLHRKNATRTENNAKITRE